MVTFRNPANGATITVPVIDRGPFIPGRHWDLSAATCAALDHCYTGPIQWR
jgi:rare lipoprotein A (peptidoglycan hydrolase)